MVPLVALKVADVEPAVTVADAGTVNSAFPLDSVTAAPPAGAAPVSVTVQVVVLELFKVDGVHDSEATVGRTGAPRDTVPPVPDITTLYPEPDTPMMLLIPIDTLLTPVASARLTTATVPFEIMPVFIPETRQVYAPELATQFTVLPALEAPATTEIEAMLPGGYVSVH